ncbi:type II 3-dehydroquinate dehydratase [Myroides sp. NP-2]|uniref:type II 3-dehydroquinate dehydratase n=1 Tax=Myroides sp. NP-2 TaxID=2759945 RepID=UPI0015FDB16C|nr:type II 3-dehydroquinate dehydratase [Myroides sp. NP-2]MBB1151220.1 type II 3-dehydroquinate dehydratase [Myroides sp. NP-2]
MKILILNGPNLNLLGKREPSIYGDTSFEEYFEQLKAMFPALELDYFQSNSEGRLLDKIHEVGFSYSGIVINAGAYTHTSIALRDAIAAISTPVIEVHISNTHGREDFRKESKLAAVCRGVILGFGLKSYELALRAFHD